MKRARGATVRPPKRRGPAPRLAASGHLRAGADRSRPALTLQATMARFGLLLDMTRCTRGLPTAPKQTRATRLWQKG